MINCGIATHTQVHDAQCLISDTLCFHCNNQAMDFIQFIQIHKQTDEAVFMPVSW